ncbi:MAG: hypothetical protein A3G93_01790 [Nitrospinae bacterium RIFCSPLOWO2_12_FULL_45_22]|nr:MAG: hypothetical protein A3G93_01790 [Nitrospinae bacterium RIFCSPLOWO2_12_FULL_45_22]
MIAVYILMICSGVLMIGWGFWASYNARRPVDVIGAIMTPVGLLLTLTGIILLCIPNFFW